MTVHAWTTYKVRITFWLLYCDSIELDVQESGWAMGTRRMAISDVQKQQAIAMMKLTDPRCEEYQTLKGRS